MYAHKCLSITLGRKGSEHGNRPTEMKNKQVEQGGPKHDSSPPEGTYPDQGIRPSKVVHLTQFLMVCKWMKLHLSQLFHI